MKYVIQGFQFFGIMGSVLIGFLLIRAVWTHPNPLGGRAAMTLLAVAVVWCFVSTWRWSVSFRKVPGANATRLLLGARPVDEAAVSAWKLGRHFRYAWITLLACLILSSYYIWVKQ